MINSAEIQYELWRDYFFTISCPFCGELMSPMPGGFQCEECGHVVWTKMWILKKGGNRYVVYEFGNRGWKAPGIEASA